MRAEVHAGPASTVVAVLAKWCRRLAPWAGPSSAAPVLVDAKEVLDGGDLGIVLSHESAGGKAGDDLGELMAGHPAAGHRVQGAEPVDIAVGELILVVENGEVHLTGESEQRAWGLVFSSTASVRTVIGRPGMAGML